MLWDDDATKAHRGSVVARLWISAAVALAASLATVFWVFGNQGVVNNVGDPYDYGRIARGFLEHGFDKLTRRAAMLYPHLLAAVYWLGGSDVTVQVIQCFLHAGTTILTFSLASRLYNARTAFIAALLTALHPMLLRYVADLHTETLLVFMSMSTVWCAVRFYDRPTIGNGALLGAIGMIATLTKGVMLPFVVVFGAGCALRALRQPDRSIKRLGPVMAMFLTMAVVVAPWTYRNYQVSGGKFVPLTPGTADAFLRGYIFTRLEFATLQKPPYVDAENESNALFRGIAKQAGVTWSDDEVVDEVNNQRVMKQMIIRHPFETARKVVVGFFTFWYEMTSLTNSLVPAALAVAGWVLAFVGLRRGRGENRPSWLLLLPILVLNVFVATLVPLGRYSVPVLPCLAILAAFGVDTLLGPTGRRERVLLPLLGKEHLNVGHIRTAD
jgi:4-amino-4-deoxy-L-arabinose transferase-like glycosyltransferase